MTDLIKVPELTPAMWDSRSIAGVVDQIIAHVGSIAIDASTPAGRKEAISLAAQVRSSKVFIDEAGKSLVAGIKEQAKVIDAQRKDARDRLDALAETVRRPATEWELAEAARTNNLRRQLQRLEDVPSEIASRDPSHWTPERLEAIKVALDEMGRVDWQEFGEDAERAATRAADAVTAMRQSRAQWEIDQRDLEALRAAARVAEVARAEEERKAREARIAQEAAERAVRIERERTQQAEAARRVLEAEQLRKEQEQAASTEHRKRINQAALAALVVLGLDEKMAKFLITNIAKGHVPGIIIKY